MMKYSGKIRDGALIVNFPEAFEKELELFDGKDVWIELREDKKRRSSQQNNYYWGVVIPSYIQIFAKAGLDFGNEKTHDILKTRFLLVKDPYTRIKSTTELNPTEFNNYIMNLQAWAATDFDYIIPDPT
jgi:hypothetical protein